MRTTPPVSPLKLTTPQTSPLDRARNVYRFIQTAAPAAGTAGSSEAGRDARIGQPTEETRDGSAGAAAADAPLTPTIQGTGRQHRLAYTTMDSPEFARAVLQELSQDRQDKSVLTLHRIAGFRGP